MTEPSELEVITMADCSFCKKDSQVFRINDKPTGCQHEYCEKCLRILVLPNEPVKKCIINGCNHIIEIEILRNFISKKLYIRPPVPLKDTNIMRRNHVFRKTPNTTGQEIPFQTLEIPNCIKYVGFHDYFNLSENFLLVVDPESAFNEINTVGSHPNAPRIFLHIINNYYVLKPTGRIIPFKCSIGLFGRCPLCYTCFNLYHDKVNVCKKCKVTICLCCGLQNCQEHIMTKEELANFASLKENKVYPLTFLSVEFNVPFIIKPFNCLGLSKDDLNLINKIIILFAFKKNYPGQTWNMLTDIQKNEFRSKQNSLIVFHKTYLENSYANFQYTHGIPNQYIAYLIRTTYNSIATSNIDIQNKTMSQTNNEATGASGTTVMRAAVASGTSVVRHQNGISSLLAAAKKIDEESVEPAAKKSRIPIPTISEIDLKSLHGNKYVKASSLPIDLPKLIQPAMAAAHQVEIAIHFSKVNGMPKFVFPYVENPTQYERARMYREQIYVANAYIDMAIKKISEKTQRLTE